MVKKIFTESPEDEQWKMLLNYTYPNNVKRYFEKKQIINPTDDLVEGICGSISQAKEYLPPGRSKNHQLPVKLRYQQQEIHQPLPKRSHLPQTE